MTKPSPVPTIADVARHAGVSKKTVSFVINGLGGTSAVTRERVEAAVAALGFVPSQQARALATGRSSLIALVHDGSDGAALLAAQAGIARALAGTGCALVVELLADGAAQLGAFLAVQRPRGLILLPPLSARPDLLAACDAAGCACVRIGPSRPEDATPARIVSSQDRQAAFDAASYLMVLGHRRIGFIAGPDHDLAARERELGFIDALAEQGLDRGAEIVAQGDGGFASGREAGHLLLDVSPRPDAILAASGAMAAGVLRAAQERGVAVPDDLSVMAIGDVADAEQLVPPLSAMCLPLADMAHGAALKLLRPAEAAALPVDFYAALTPRGSTGPARDQAAAGRLLQSG